MVKLMLMDIYRLSTCDVLLAQKCILYAITLEYCRHIRCYIILQSRCTKTEVCYCLEREELAAVMIAFILFSQRYATYILVLVL